MSRTILLPIDLNDPQSWTHSLPEALSLLGESGTLHVVSVLHDFDMALVSGFFPAEYEKKALASFGEALVNWTASNVPEGINVHPHVLHGTIYDEILRVADKLEVDVIVIGSHGLTFKDYLLGPNAAQVVRHAKCSVYVVRG